MTDVYKLCSRRRKIKRTKSKGKKEYRRIDSLVTSKKAHFSEFSEAAGEGFSYTTGQRRPYSIWKRFDEILVVIKTWRNRVEYISIDDGIFRKLQRYRCGIADCFGRTAYKNCRIFPVRTDFRVKRAAVIATRKKYAPTVVGRDRGE